MRIVDAISPEDISAAKSLFVEYAESMGHALCFQSFEAEMAAFPGEFAPPTGALLLGRIDGRAAGAVGLRGVGGGWCEIKRLYVRPSQRGAGLGAELARRIVTVGRALGYHGAHLETAPRLQGQALALYRRMGFRETPDHESNPSAEVLSLALAFWPEGWSQNAGSATSP
jgi:GNAT superfamily N-acetyltransferase